MRLHLLHLVWANLAVLTASFPYDYDGPPALLDARVVKISNTSSFFSSVQGTSTSSTFVASTSSIASNTTFTSGNSTAAAHALVAAPQVINVTPPAKPQGVFAHFMVGNVPTWTLQSWTNDINVAIAARIDAFALNMAYNEDGGADAAQVDLAFAAANKTSFKLFFSFDYAGNGAWPSSAVLKLIQQYQNNPAYYKYNNKPFVSTFEGPANANDWISIKKTTGCFFMPDWSSLGAAAAVNAGGGVADGLFSWAAWPWGNNDMNTYVDASYIQFLAGKPYMMPVSPWYIAHSLRFAANIVRFYTNLPGYTKNWLWRGKTSSYVCFN
jgi:hypothetical protein